VRDGRSAAVEALWLDALQDVVGRAAHEIKGALNGVSVNLEVVRTRSAGGGSGPASGVARFAEAAAGQLDELVTMTEALLALTRRPRGDADPLSTARHLVALLASAAQADGGRLEIEGGTSSDAVTDQPTSAPAAVVRLILARAMLGALARRTATVCRVDAKDGIVIRLECADAGTIELERSVTRVAAKAGIRVEGGSTGLSLAFPRAGRSSGLRMAAPSHETA
jgi:signal transduction histidine kinase